MSLRSTRAALLIAVVVCLSFGYAVAGARAQDPSYRASLPAPEGTAAELDAQSSATAIVYSQPPSPSGGLLPSSWWQSGDTPYGRYVWDDFTLSSAQTLTEVRWRGGFDPTKYGSGGPVLDFTIAFHGSIAVGTEPDVVNPPLASYQAGGNAGQTPAGTLGGIPMYDYSFTLPIPFEAAAGTRYWVQIVASQGGEPDWGITVGTGGNGQHYRKIAAPGRTYFQTAPGDAAFTLLGQAAPAARVYLPLIQGQ